MLIRSRTIWPLKICFLMNIINSGQAGASGLTIPSSISGDFSEKSVFLSFTLDICSLFWLHPLKDGLLLMENWCGSDMGCLIFSLFWRCVIRGLRSSPSGFSSTLPREFWTSYIGNGFFNRYSSSCVKTCLINSAIDR